MFRSLTLWAIFLIFLKLFITAFFPVIGDEAYYFYWGLHPAGGYYDLPPMVGWWLIPFSKISLLPIWLRMPNLISVALVTFGIYEYLKESVSHPRARLIAGLYFFLPLPFIAVLMFPDIPLLLFGFYSSLLFYRATNSERTGITWIEFFLSGVLWGAAFLSKYFAILFLPALVIWYLSQKKKKSWMHVFFFTLGTLPFLFQHLYWNANHCWANFVFNLVSRQKANDGTVFQTFGLFIIYLLLISTPLFWGAFSKRVETPLEKGFQSNEKLKELDRFFVLLWSVPTLIFGLTTLFGKGQGLHWLLFVTPYFVVSAGLRVLETDLRDKLKKMMWITGSLSTVILLMLCVPDLTAGQFFKNRLTFDYKLVTHPDDFIQAVLPTLKNSEMVFTEGYTLSSVLDYQFKRYSKKHDLDLPSVSVWGGGSRFGRVFDWTIDWKALQGKNITLITPGPIDNFYWNQYFSSIDASVLQFQGQSFYVLVGIGFKPRAYVEREFKKAIESFYPAFGPGACQLKEE